MFEFSVRPEKAPGRWYTYTTETDQDGKPAPVLCEGKPVRARIRAIPEPKLLEINIRHFGRKRELTWKRDETRGQIDPEAQAKSNVEKAIFALVDTDHWAVLPSDEESAAALRDLGIPAEAEKPAYLDGHWTPKVREWFFGLHLTVAAWVASKAGDESSDEAREEAEGKGTSSPA